MLKINWREYYESTVIPSIVLAGFSVIGKSAIDGTMVPELFPFLFLFFLAVITLNEGYDRWQQSRFWDGVLINKKYIDVNALMGKGSTTPK